MNSIPIESMKPAGRSLYGVVSAADLSARAQKDPVIPIQDPADFERLSALIKELGSDANSSGSPLCADLVKVPAETLPASSSSSCGSAAAVK